MKKKLVSVLVLVSALFSPAALAADLGPGDLKASPMRGVACNAQRGVVPKALGQADKNINWAEKAAKASSAK